MILPGTFFPVLRTKPPETAKVLGRQGRELCLAELFLQGAATKAAHHLANLVILPKKLVDFLHRGAAAAGDAPTAAAVEDLRVVHFLRCHRIEGGLGAKQA